MDYMTNSASYLKLKACAEHLAHVWDRVLFVHVCLEGRLSNEEMAKLMTPSRAAHV